MRMNERKPEFIGDLFAQPPQQWSLRGDEALWRELENHFQDKPLPNSRSALKADLFHAFEVLTGHPVTVGVRIRVASLGGDGMSGGMVDPAFWIKTAFPLIVERLQLYSAGA